MCLLDWSRCCSCFVLFWFVLLVFVLFVCACFFLFLMKITVFPAILVFLVYKKVNLCFSFQFLVLAFCFCFVCFLFQDVLLFLVFCLFSCFVLNHNIIFVALLLVFLLLFFGFCCFGILLFFEFGYLSKTSLKQLEIPKTPKMKIAEKRTF